MRWLTLAEVLALHRQLIEQSGGSEGLRDLGLLESAWLSRGRASPARICTQVLGEGCLFGLLFDSEPSFR